MSRGTGAAASSGLTVEEEIEQQPETPARRTAPTPRARRSCHRRHLAHTGIDLRSCAAAQPWTRRRGDQPSRAGWKRNRSRIGSTPHARGSTTDNGDVEDDNPAHAGIDRARAGRCDTNPRPPPHARGSTEQPGNVRRPREHRDRPHPGDPPSVEGPPRPQGIAPGINRSGRPQPLASTPHVRGSTLTLLPAPSQRRPAPARGDQPKLNDAVEHLTGFPTGAGIDPGPAARPDG